METHEKEQVLSKQESDGSRQKSLMKELEEKVKDKQRDLEAAQKLNEEYEFKVQTYENNEKTFMQENDALRKELREAIAKGDVHASSNQSYEKTLKSLEGKHERVVEEIKKDRDQQVERIRQKCRKMLEERDDVLLIVIVYP